MEPFTAPLNTPPPRVHPFPGNRLLHVAQLDRESGDAAVDPVEVRTPVTDLAQAVLVSSEMDDGSRRHRPVLDLDLPAFVLPSSTPGHVHLFIDRPMGWVRYQRLLEALADAGLVERNYVAASTRRRQTGVRVPWIRKGDRLPVLEPELGDPKPDSSPPALAVVPARAAEPPAEPEAVAW